MMKFIFIAAALFMISMPICSDTIEEPLFTCSFDEDDWYKAWGLRNSPERTAIINKDQNLNFEPYKGNALKIRVDKNGHYGLSLQYRFMDRLGYEPESIFFSYRLRLADDWNPKQGGKLPGISGTYGRAGWGGRPVNGQDGWSARGLFKGQVNGLTPVGYYCYHADMKGQYGENWVWDIERRGYLENNRWYHIEQFIKLNTPKHNDGVLKAWVDGQLAFEKNDVRMRDTDALKIEAVWVNLYHGGKWTAETEDHIFIDEVLITERS